MKQGRGYPVAGMFLPLAVILLTLIVVDRGRGGEPLAPGVTYHLYQTDHPNQVHVVKFDRSHPEYELVMGWPYGRRSSSTRQTATDIISNYHQPPETDVLAAINASFFGSGNSIIGNLATGGNYLQIPDSSRNWPVFSWHDDGTMNIDMNPALMEQWLLLPNNTRIDIDRINENRSANTLVLYTPDWGPTTGADTAGVEIVIEAVNYPMRLGKRMQGVVREIRAGEESINNPIPLDGAVLSVTGLKSETLLEHLSVGDNLNWRFTLSSRVLNNARLIVDGAGWLLHDGEVASSTWNFGSGFMGRHPRTIMAWNETHGFFVVIDGRSEESVGMSFEEMANFLRDTLGVTNALNLDGGGSSTLVVGGEVRNTPAGGRQRALTNVIMLVRRDASGPDAVMEDTFPPTGRQLPWDDKFTPNLVEAFDPPAPGGDGYVMVVRDPTGGFEVTRVGNVWDRDYFVEAWIYCELRSDQAASGFERLGIFARDAGNGAFDVRRYGRGNNYLFAFDSHTGEILAGKTVNGETTNFLEETVTITESGWHQFRMVLDGDEIAYYLDGKEIHRQRDSTFSHGVTGVGHHNRFSPTALGNGTRVGSFRWGAIPDEWLGSGVTILD